ncbi:MAG TPA: YfhO family protein [Chloroflexota bacterium]|nr:YfhO family protein [Chloroflexota bacterium]
MQRNKLGKLEAPSWSLVDLGAIVALVGFALLLFWPVVFEGQFVPRGGGDLVSFIYPRYAFVAHFVRQKTLPLWDPYLYGGQPYLADVQSGLLYPINLIAFALFRTFDYRKMEWLAIIHYALAGAFAYFWARQLRFGRIGAFTAGLVWECSGFLVAHLGHYNLIAVAVWIPLVLGLIQPALEGRSLAWVAGASMALAISTFAGHTQLSLYAGLLIAIYVAGFAIAVRSWRGPLLVLAILGLWSILLTVVQLWPSFQLTNLSVRADLSYADSTQFAVLPQKLILFLIPHFYGQTPDNYWGPPSLTENYGYLGILPLALAGLALLAVRDWRARTLGVVAALGLLLSFADWTPLHGWLFALVPGFDKVRAPGRFLFFVDLGIAMLAGLGADVLSRPLSARRRPLFRLYLGGWAVLAVGLTVIAAPLVYLHLFENRSQNQALVDQINVTTSSFALMLVFLLATLALLTAYRYHWLKGRGLAGVMIALIVVDLVGNNAVINPTPNDPTSGFNHPPVVAFLQKNLGHARIDTVTGVEDIWQPDAPALYGFRSLWGLFDPLTLTDYYWFWKIHVPGRSSRLYDLLGARYVLGHKNVVLDTKKFRLAFGGDSQINVYENPNALPRAFFVSHAIATPNHDAALNAIKAKDFDPGTEVVLETPPPTNAPKLAAPVAATFQDDGPNSIVLQINAPQAGYVVLADPYYPGWQASVDGNSAPVLRADWTFRAVPVPAGTHQVIFRFRPASLVVGGAISGLAWLLALATVAFGLWQTTQRRKVQIS